MRKSPIQKKFPTGPGGWGICVTSGTNKVEASITGPQSGWYSGSWMTPEEAEKIGVGLIQAAQTARERVEFTKEIAA